MAFVSVLPLKRTADPDFISFCIIILLFFFFAEIDYANICAMQRM